jgi:hypothetical protein
LSNSGCACSTDGVKPTCRVCVVPHPARPTLKADGLSVVASASPVVCDKTGAAVSARGWRCVAGFDVVWALRVSELVSDTALAIAVAVLTDRHTATLVLTSPVVADVGALLSFLPASFAGMGVGRRES